MAGHHTFEGVILFRTGAAIRFNGHYWGEDASCALWFPISQVTIEPDNEDTGSVVLHVKDWLAKKRQLLEFTHYSAEEIEAMDAK